MTYSVRFDKSAEREIDRLSRKTWERVHRKLEQLTSNPRPPGCLKLTGIENTWRVRVGDIRIVYEIDDAARTVTVARVRDRKDAYR